MCRVADKEVRSNPEKAKWLVAPPSHCSRLVWNVSAAKKHLAGYDSGDEDGRIWEAIECGSAGGGDDGECAENQNWTEENLRSRSQNSAGDGDTACRGGSREVDVDRAVTKELRAETTRRTSRRGPGKRAKSAGEKIVGYPQRRLDPCEGERNNRGMS